MMVEEELPQSHSSGERGEQLVITPVLSRGQILWLRKRIGREANNQQWLLGVIVVVTVGKMD